MEPSCRSVNGLTNEETGTTALMVQALESKTELIPMAVRPAARD